MTAVSALTADEELVEVWLTIMLVGVASGPYKL
jgi:hypothetical protein